MLFYQHAYFIQIHIRHQIDIPYFNLKDLVMVFGSKVLRERIRAKVSDNSVLIWVSATFFIFFQVFKFLVVQISTYFCMVHSLPINNKITTIQTSHYLWFVWNFVIFFEKR